MHATLYGLKPQDIERLAGNEIAIGNYFESCEDSCDLDWAWHGLHFLLTGSAVRTESPLSFIVGGFNTLTGSDAGFGEATYLTGPEVAVPATALAGVSPEDLRQRYQPEVMQKSGVYPAVIWTRPRELESNLVHVQELLVEVRDFVEVLARRRKSMLVRLA